MVEPSELTKYFSSNAVRQPIILPGIFISVDARTLSTSINSLIFCSGWTSSILCFWATSHSASTPFSSAKAILFLRLASAAKSHAVSTTFLASSLVHLFVEAKPIPPFVSILTQYPPSSVEMKASKTPFLTTSCSILASCALTSAYSTPLLLA